MKNFYLVFAIVMLAGCTKAASQEAPKTLASLPDARPMYLTPGRFEVKQLGQMRADQYLIDTATGQIWQHVCAGKMKNFQCSNLIWQREIVEGM